MPDHRLLVAPRVMFGGHFRHPCMAGLNRYTPCSNVMVVPDPETEGAPDVLTEGQIWSCNNCGALHEYYVIAREGIPQGCVRLWRGDGARESGEPGVTEFLVEEPEPASR